MEILDEIWKVRHPKDVLFLSIIDGYTLKESEDYPKYIFYMKGDKILFVYNKKTKEVLINDWLIWGKFEFRFDLNYVEVGNLLKSLLETHLKLKNTTPEMMFRFIVEEFETKLKLI